MTRKKMEGDEAQRRRKARKARARGKARSETAATTGASKQRHHLKHNEGHTKKLGTIPEGKQPMLSERTPKPRPGSSG